MKYIYLFLLALIPLVAVNAKANKQTVVLSCNLHCQGCCDKVMNNIAWEKGVKDLQCDLKTKTVTVTFDANKTDVPTLLQAFDKIGKPATVKSHLAPRDSEPPTAPTTVPATHPDAATGASTLN